MECLEWAWNKSEEEKASNIGTTRLLLLAPMMSIYCESSLCSRAWSSCLTYFTRSATRLRVAGDKIEVPQSAFLLCGCGDGTVRARWLKLGKGVDGPTACLGFNLGEFDKNHVTFLAHTVRSKHEALASLETKVMQKTRTTK